MCDDDNTMCQLFFFLLRFFQIAFWHSLPGLCFVQGDSHKKCEGICKFLGDTKIRHEKCVFLKLIMRHIPFHL